MEPAIEPTADSPAGRFAASIGAGTNPDSNNAKGRQRHGVILEVASQGPVWAQLLVSLKIVPSVAMGRRVLARMHEKGLVRLLGQVLINDTGHPTSVYGNYDPG